MLTVGLVLALLLATPLDEPLEDGQIDLGELVAQHLYLHLCELGEARLLESAQLS